MYPSSSEVVVIFSSVSLYSSCVRFSLAFLSFFSSDATFFSSVSCLEQFHILFIPPPLTHFTSMPVTTHAAPFTVTPLFFSLSPRSLPSLPRLINVTAFSRPSTLFLALPSLPLPRVTNHNATLAPSLSRQFHHHHKLLACITASLSHMPSPRVILC